MACQILNYRHWYSGISESAAECMAKLMKSDRFDPSKAHGSPESVLNVSNVAFMLSLNLKSLW
jgi:hypothetical protein